MKKANQSLPGHIRRIVTEAGWDPGNMEKFSRGTSTYRVASDVILKVYEDNESAFHAEQRALRSICENTPARVPEVLLAASLEGVPYCFFIGTVTLSGC